MPDSGFAYTNKIADLNLEKDYSTQRFSHLLKRIDYDAEIGYEDFKRNDASLNNRPLKIMSNLTKRILYNINYKVVLEKRNKNFKLLHNALKNENELSEIIESEKINGPMIYPF